MSFESTLPDAASVVGNTPGFSTAVTSLWGPARAQATGVTSGSAGDVGNAVWLKGKGYRRITGYDNSGQPIYRHLDPTERARPEFRDEDTKLANELAHQREDRLAARDSQIRAEDRRRWEQQAAQSKQQIDNALRLGLGSQFLSLASLNANTENTKTQFELTREELRRNTDLRLREMKQSKDQFTQTLAASTLARLQESDNLRYQIQEQGKLQRDKMAMEGDQFNRQMAQDERTSRRAKVINSLSIVAQSLARL